MVTKRPCPPPIACDCCDKPLQAVYGSFHRAEWEFSFASLPYVICADCAMQYRRRHTPAHVLAWIQRRAARAGVEFGRCVGHLLAAAGNGTARNGR